MSAKIKNAAKRMFVVFFVCLLFASFVSGEEEVFEVEEVILTGTRVEEEGVPADKLPASVIVIKGDDLKKTQDNSLPETLSKYAGFNYMDTVGLGGDAKLHLRGVGGDSGSIITLLDGVRINESAFHEVFWKAIPLDAIEKIEVIKGGMSSTYGEGALAGVVNIITKKKMEKSGVYGLWGGFGKKELSFVSGVPAGTFNVLVNGYYEKNNGIRAGSDYGGGGGFVKISKDGVKARHSLMVNVHKNNTDIPSALDETQIAFDPKQVGNCANDYENSNSTLSLQEIYKFKGFSTTTQLYYRKRDTLGKTACPVFSYTSESNTDGKAYGGVLQLNIGNGKNSLVTGVEYGKEFFNDASSDNFGTNSKNMVDKKNLAFYVQNIYQMTPKLNLTAALRWDDVKYDLDVFSFETFSQFKGERKAKATSPKFGINFSATEKINVYASYSKSFLSPTGYQFTGVAHPFQPNPNLEPTISKEYSVGFRVKSKAAKTDVNFFQMKTTDEIIFNNETFANENVDVKRTGAELSVEHQFSPKLSGLLNASVLDSSFESDKTYFGKNIAGKKLPFTPGTTFGAGLYYSPSQKLDLNLNSTFVFDFYPTNDLNNEKKAKNYNLTNLKAAYRTGWGSIAAYVNNLFNSEYSSFPLSNGCPMEGCPDQGFGVTPRKDSFNPQPSRSFGLSMQYSF